MNNNSYAKGETLLKAENINLGYDEKQILRDVNIEIKDIIRPGVKQGQVVSLVGRSGIGKTQLFKTLAGLQKPTSGTITISGNKPVQAGDMGVVFQNYYLFGWRTIQANLLLSAKKNPELKGKELAEVRNYAEQFNLTEHLNKYPQQLSGGQRQRASIIQQLVNGSEFLLLDEPFSGLDVIVLEKVVKLLQQVSLSDDKKTLIIVSHDLETTTALSDTIFILAQEPNKPGATIVKTIDLIERDCAWQPDIKSKPEFIETIKEIKGLL